MVPEGWDRNALSQIVKEKISYGIVQAGPHVDDGMPYIKSSDVRGEIDPSCLKRTSHEIHHKYRRSSVHPGDIVFSLRGNIGECAIVPDGLEEANLTQGTARISVANGHDNRFYFYQLQSAPLLNRIYALSKGSTFKEISLEELRKVKVFSPPFPEQEEIAKILSAWDEATATTEQLLANSEQQKKALMQKLLTGKQRLPGFREDWKKVDLGDLFSFKKGAGLSKGSLSDAGTNKCVLYGELYTKYGEVIGDVESQTDEEKGVRSRAGDVLIPCSTTTSGIDLANATALLEDGVLLGGDITILRPITEDVDPVFIAHYLTHEKKHEIASLAQGITIVHLYGSDLKSLKVKVPASREEQKAIADVLVKEDHVIAALAEQLGLLKEEKRALMQQLLTGKRRVKVDEAEQVTV